MFKKILTFFAAMSLVAAFAAVDVNKGSEADYMKDGAYSIENIQGKKFSFVSNSSTSGYKVPAKNVVNFFSAQDKWKELKADDLLEALRAAKEQG
jgi:phosphonate transport system substrate-binding protein